MPNSGMNAKTAQRDDWRTPRWLFDRLNETYRFTVDAAADESNHLLPRWWGVEDDGVSSCWAGERIFCNPPFSRKKWWALKAALRVADLTVMILPATVEQAWFHNAVIGKARTVWVPDKRIAFDAPPGVAQSGPRFASLIVEWNVSDFRFSRVATGIRTFEC